MLNRALLEEALDVHWVAANPDIAPGYADDHDRMVALAEREMEVRFGRPAEPLTAEQRSELKALRKRYANFRAPWTLATDATRIA
jgi:type IV pilus biogenesis protein CpaD/CtpE